MKVYKKSRDLINDSFSFDLTGFNERLDLFFSICIQTNELILIKSSDIITKCVSIENENETFLSPVVSLIEHD